MAQDIHSMDRQNLGERQAPDFLLVAQKSTLLFPMPAIQYLHEIVVTEDHQSTCELSIGDWPLAFLEVRQRGG